MNQYYWVTGRDRRHTLTTAGPYLTREEAEEATAHLQHTQVHVLNTRAQDKAKRILQDRLQRGGGGMHADEPVPTDGPPERRRGMVGRLQDMLPRGTPEPKEYKD